MKLISWNCQGAFRKKYTKILGLNPDILVIQECENAEKLRFGKLTPTPNDFFWYGENNSKGLGIFSYSDYKFELIREFNPKFRYIIPFKVTGKNESFLLFAVWAMDNKENHNARYIAQVWLALNYYSRLLQHNLILVGDFNSNKIWDDQVRLSNHSEVVDMLRKINIFSLYHENRQLEHGLESEHTFYLYRNLEKRYHIDYCFASNDFLNSTYQIHLGTASDWLEHSDHVPLQIELETETKHIDMNNSLFEFVIFNSMRFHPITNEKFQSTIEKLKFRAANSDQNDFSLQHQTERHSIIKAIERLEAINENIIKLEDDGC